MENRKNHQANREIPIFKTSRSFKVKKSIKEENNNKGQYLKAYHEEDKIKDPDYKLSTKALLGNYDEVTKEKLKLRYSSSEHIEKFKINDDTMDIPNELVDPLSVPYVSHVSPKNGSKLFHWHFPVAKSDTNVLPTFNKLMKKD